VKKFKHLRDYEKKIWERFLQTEIAKTYKAFEYDIIVGDPPPPPPSTPKELINNWQYLASLKIDAIGHKDDEIAIFEIKDIATPRGIYQLLAYKDLYIKKYKPTKPVRLYLISPLTRPDTQFLANLYNIEIITV